MAKKIVAIIICIFLFTSCGLKGQTLDEERIKAQIDEPFTTGAVIKYKDIEAHANISKDGLGGYEVMFLSPESLKDISFKFADSKISISYDDISFELDPASKTGGAVTTMIIEAINAAAKDSGVQISLSDGAVVIEGSMQDGAFTLKLDEESGNFLSLDIPSNELYMSFNNFEILG